MAKMQLSEDWFYMDMALPTPISVTHDLLESGRKGQKAANAHKGFRMQVNFQSYDFKDFRLDVGGASHKLHKQIKDKVTTSYRRDYRAPYPLRCPQNEVKEYIIDPQFNCKPVHAFQMLLSAPGKFMDDGLAEPSAARKRINFFRQLRTLHHVV